MVAGKTQTHQDAPMGLSPGPGPPVVPCPSIHARVPSSSVHGSVALAWIPCPLPPPSSVTALCASLLSCPASSLNLALPPQPLGTLPQSPFRLCSLPSVRAPSLRLCLRSTNSISSHLLPPPPPWEPTLLTSLEASSQTNHTPTLLR